MTVTTNAGFFFPDQEHWAHQDREDGRRSPAAVLGWVSGRHHAPEDLQRIFSTTRSSRHLDRLGCVRFRHWRLYGEQGIAGEDVAVWLYRDLLTLEFAGAPLSQYLVTYVGDHRQVQTVTPLRQFETPYRSPQLSLWELQPQEWLLELHLPVSARQPKRDLGMVQQRLVL